MNAALADVVAYDDLREFLDIWIMRPEVGGGPEAVRSALGVVAALASQHLPDPSGEFRQAAADAGIVLEQRRVRRRNYDLAASLAAVLVMASLIWIGGGW